MVRKSVLTLTQSLLLRFGELAAAAVGLQFIGQTEIQVTGIGYRAASKGYCENLTLFFGLQVPRVPHWSTSQGTLPLLDFGKSEHNISFGYWDGAFCHRKGLLRGNSLFRLSRRQGCVRDSRFRRAASVLDVPFAAELAILAATHPKSLTQSSQFASRTGESSSAGYFALFKVSPVRIPVCFGEP